MENAPRIPLVLLPGLLCDAAVWEYQARAVSDIAMPSIVDYGSADSLAGMAQTALRTAPEQFALAGHSMGGRVALEVYRAAPDRVTHLALLNTGYLPRSNNAVGQQEERDRYAFLEIAKTRGMRAMAEQWLPPMMNPARRTDSALTSAIIEMFARKNPEIFEAQIKALLNRPDATPVLQQIRCPTLLLSGREDSWSPLSRHAEMAALIPSPPAPKARLVEVPDCGHMSTLEQPQAVSEALYNLLAENPIS